MADARDRARDAVEETIARADRAYLAGKGALTEMMSDADAALSFKLQKIVKKNGGSHWQVH